MSKRLVLAPIKRVLWPIVVLGIAAVAAAPAPICVMITGDTDFWALLLAIAGGGGWLPLAAVALVVASIAHFVQWLITGESEIFYLPWHAIADFFDWLTTPGLTEAQRKRQKLRAEHERSLQFAREAEEARIRPYLKELDEAYPGVEIKETE